MPNIHPLMVHFPIALFITGFIVSMAGYILKKNILKDAGLVMVIFGAIGAVAANLSGHQAEETVEKFLSEAGKEALEDHETFGNITVFVLSAVAVIHLLGAVILKGKRKAARALLGAYIAVGIAGIVLLTLTADKGGHMVYEHGAGVDVAAIRAGGENEHNH